ncbi:MAG: hypothetical protein ACOC33_00565 [bacterium]
MDIKRMDIKEFREKGYLQEVNRRFLHPLGLALEVLMDEEEEKLGGVWDFRDDPEGLYYDLKNSPKQRIEKFTKNREFIDKELIIRTANRKEMLGFVIEPIPEIKRISTNLELSNSKSNEISGD